MDYNDVYEELFDIFIKHCYDDNLIEIKKFINEWYIDYQTIQIGLNILGKNGNLEIIEYIFDNYKESRYDESYMIDIETILFYTCHNDTLNKKNLDIIKYLLGKNPELEINYQKLFNISCLYDLNIVRYFLELKPDMELQEGLDNASYNLYKYPSNYNIIKYLIGHNLSLKLDYSFYSIFININISNIEHIEFIYNNVVNYFIKIKPYFLYIIINTYNTHIEKEYLKKYEKMYIDKIRLLQIRLKEIIYSPYTDKGLAFIEKKRDELF